jgi:hypothetical protein
MSDVTDLVTQHSELGLGLQYSSCVRFQILSNIAEGLSCLGCDVVSLGQYFLNRQGYYHLYLQGEAVKYDTVFLQNIRNYLPNDTASHPKRLEYVVYEDTISFVGQEI